MQGQPFFQAGFDDEIQKWEAGWTRETNPYPTEPQGHTLEITRRLIGKYAPAFAI